MHCCSHMQRPDETLQRRSVFGDASEYKSCGILTVARDFIWVMIGRLVTALVALVAIRLSTSLLPPEQFGSLAILLTFQVFCGLFLINPVGQYINRQTHVWVDEGTLLPRLRNYRQWVVVAALAGALASSLWTISQPIEWSERAMIMATVSLMVAASTANATSVYLLNMLGRRALSVTWAGATVALGLLLSWALALAFGTGLAWFAGQALGLAIGAIGASRAVRRALPASRAGRWPLLEPGVLRSYIFPLAFATGLMWWLLSGHRLLVEAHWGLAALGQAVVGLALAAQLWGLVESLAMQFLYPLFYRRIAASNTPDSALAFSDLLNSLGPIYLVLAAATAVGAPSLLALLVDASYSHVAPFVLLGAVIECCRALGNVLSTAAQVDRRMGALIPPYAAGALTLTAGLLWLMQVNGSIDQAIAVLAGAGGVTLVAMAFAMRQLQAFRIDLPRWLAAIALVLLAIPLVEYQPQARQGLAAAFQSVVAIGLFATVSIAALLWRNPRIARLLNVRLNPTIEKK